MEPISIKYLGKSYTLILILFCVKKKKKFFYLGGTIYTSKEFILFIDSTVAAHSTNFMSSVTMLFASFYIFNIEYPETACITLEFLQR